MKTNKHFVMVVWTKSYFKTRSVLNVKGKTPAVICQAQKQKQKQKQELMFALFSHQPAATSIKITDTLPQ